MPRSYRSRSLRIMESIDRQNQREAELKARRPPTPPLPVAEPTAITATP